MNVANKQMEKDLWLMFLLLSYASLLIDAEVLNPKHYELLMMNRDRKEKPWIKPLGSY